MPRHRPKENRRSLDALDVSSFSRQGDAQTDLGEHRKVHATCGASAEYASGSHNLSPPRPEVNPRIQRGVCRGLIPALSRSPVLWESGTQHKNREHRLCPASLVIRQLRSHISIHLSYNYQLPNVTTPEENDTSTSQRQSRWLSSPSGQGRQPCSQTSGRQNATTRRSHPRP